ncbi:GTP pyrophosphokinase [Stenoxybacter acetivorans]|uniref:GTP pyrophosphokinase n=1 Tax=Stenoxybacter acetivorans TaxID=422441 RepID=UPI001FDFCFA5|nr:GTP pyrophosphokinase [Stenoxybacter acetivorans]
MQMTNIKRTEQLIAVINDIHLQFSQDYFETGKVEKHNLSKTVVPTEHILRYRLNLHESINDYLAGHNLDGITYYYRVKTSESIHDKISRYAKNNDQYPVNNWMNDIFGARMILCTSDIEQIIELLDEWQNTYGLKNWYLRDKPEYRGLHVYFKNKSNFCFPWELQLWDKNDVAHNIENHRLYKRGFVK